VNWTVTFFDREVESALLELPTGLLARFVRYSERMEEHGPDIGTPHTRAMGEGLFELRLKASEGIARDFYCAAVGRRIVMLHHFIKKSRKTPTRELETARRRLREVRDGKYA
jgi:phage-related protein